MSDLSKAARTALEALEMTADKFQVQRNAITSLRQALAQPEQEPVTLLPDGSAFSVMSFPLPNSHWLYAEREYRDGEHEPIELGKPILTHKLRSAIVSAVRYAIRGATNCGKEMDFDPDALVQNAVYALCGPYTRHVDAVNMSQERVDETVKREHDRAVELAQAYERGWNAALAQTEQEPVGYINGMHGGYMVFTPINPSAVYLNGTALYTAPPKRQWVGLTEAERIDIIDDEITAPSTEHFALAQTIEAKLKEKNGV